MQPKRDPHDTRYWPRSDPLATGTGFSRTKPKGLSVTNPSIDQSGHNDRIEDAGRPKGTTPEAARRSSRELYALLLAKIRERVEGSDEFTLNELSAAANVAGRIGLGGEEQRDTSVTIHVVRDGAARGFSGESALPDKSNYPQLPAGQQHPSEGSEQGGGGNDEGTGGW